MIKAYVVGITTHYEGEDIEVRYSIFAGEELICKRAFFKEYQKPLVVSHVAILALLKDLKKYSDEEIIIIINDASLAEQIKGTSQTKKAEVLKMAGRVKQELSKFGNSIKIEDVSKDSERLKQWSEVVRREV